MGSSKPSLAKNLIKVGCVTDARSLGGEVWFHLFTGEAPWAPRLKTIFLQTTSGKTPDAKSPDVKSADATGPGSPSTDGVSLADLTEYKVTSLKEQSGRFVLKLQGVNDRNAAESLKGRVGWVTESLFQSKKGEPIFLREVLRFDVFDGDTRLGPVTGFESNGAQDLLVVDLGSQRTTLIPFIKEFVVKIDYPARLIRMVLPPGLVDLQNEEKSQ